MAFLLVKRPATFSLDQDETGWIELQAKRIGSNRSRIVQSLIERAAEAKDGETWRETVRGEAEQKESSAA
jgi:hypothetical protein